MFKYWIENESNGKKYYFSNNEEGFGFWTDDINERKVWFDKMKASGYYLDLAEVVTCDELRLIRKEA